MKTLSDIFDILSSIIVWVIVAFIFFGYVNMAAAQELTLGQRIVAQTILGEARGEGEAGMYGVACVVQERIKSQHWPNTMNGVCFQEGQFDFWTEHEYVTWDDDNREAVRQHMLNNTKVAQYAKRLDIHLNDLDRSYTKNADHYCRVNINNYWTRKSKSIVVIGKHKFLRLR